LANIDSLTFYTVRSPAPLSLGRAARVIVSRVPARGQGEAITSISLLKCPETEEREGGSRVLIPLPPPYFPLFSHNYGIKKHAGKTQVEKKGPPPFQETVLRARIDPASILKDLGTGRGSGSRTHDLRRTVYPSRPFELRSTGRLRVRPAGRSPSSRGKGPPRAPDSRRAPATSIPWRIPHSLQPMTKRG